MENGSQLGRSLIKQLACCNKATRDKALRVLFKTWLPSQSQLPDDDMKKLWKGLFYCVWHADKVPVQAELIDRLSSLLLVLDLGLSEHYFSTFVLTMRREWSGIDALRLDKFYLLIRRFLHNFFVLLKKNSWDLELTQRLVGVLDERTFSAEDKLQGNGVNYHIASIFLEELRPFLPIRSQVLEVLFKPFITVMGKLPDKVLLGKIKSNMFDELLKMAKRLLEVKKAGDEIDSGDDVLVLGTIGLVMGFSMKFYELGSSPECCQGNRKVLFALHEEFKKLEKDMACSGFEFSIPDVDDQDEDDVPTLVPIATTMDVDAPEGGLECCEDVSKVSNGAAGKQLKKCKKDKKASIIKEKKAKKKQKRDPSYSMKEEIATENENQVIVCENGSNDEQTNILNESVISNLQKQFEIVAAEAGLDDGIARVSDSPEATTTGTVSKKRKRTKTLKGQQSQDSEVSCGDAEGIKAVKGGEGSKKKVRFSMKNNLVWKPQNPLPPQSLRLPPSVTPRGSALKKGVPPGPIREMPLPAKKLKLKKARKAVKGVSPSVKRLRKIKSLPA
ncbi:ribosomal RNA processing protein 1 homolog isoform X1 [Neltuma alba]|uniref:ribosomal RNA processing protein 1 homolog isoform X1 n=1 Tax=Neltuma alba TaxID=207710 RepID=UPI0010A3D06D|nr:ribosomal RNA processing protein 1 homolog isoform X1 [Prosopis alba]